MYRPPSYLVAPENRVAERKTRVQFLHRFHVPQVGRWLLLSVGPPISTAAAFSSSSSFTIVLRSRRGGPALVRWVDMREPVEGKK